MCNKTSIVIITLRDYLLRHISGGSVHDFDENLVILNRVSHDLTFISDVHCQECWKLVCLSTGKLYLPNL